jgi:tRNA(Arg) A34 adenosine deaminase TadA
MDRGPTRRTSLAALMGGAALLLPGQARPVTEIAQPARPTAEAFMDRAYELRDAAVASGDQSYGAVVVRDGAIISEAPSRVVVNGDPSAHAEMEAIRDAAARTGSRDLSGAILISNARPCPMCEAAASYARIARMIHGRDLADAGSPRIRGC